MRLLGLLTFLFACASAIAGIPPIPPTPPSALLNQSNEWVLQGVQPCAATSNGSTTIPVNSGSGNACSGTNDTSPYWNITLSHTGTNTIAVTNVNNIGTYVLTLWITESSSGNDPAPTFTGITVPDAVVLSTSANTATPIFVTFNGTSVVSVSGGVGMSPYNNLAEITTYGNTTSAQINLGLNLTQYGVVYGGGASGALAATAAGTAGYVLTANSSGPPSFQPSSGVTSVGTGAGLTGGPITSTGTIAETDSIRAVTLTTDTILSTDNASLITYNNASAVAVTLPQTTTTGFGAGFSTRFENLGAGTVTVTPTTSEINGGTTLTAAQNTGCTITSDGTNYQVSACTAVVPASGGTVTSVSVQGNNLTVANGTSTPVISPYTAGGSESGTSGITLSTTDLLSGVFIRTGPTAAFTDTTPSASALATAYGTPVIGSTFWILWSNNTANLETLSGGSNVSFPGVTTVNPNSTVFIIGRFTAVSTPTVTLSLTGLNASAGSADSVMANSTSSAGPMIPTTSPVVNRWNLSGSTTTASGTGLQGCAASNCAALSSGGQFTAEAGADKHFDYTNSAGQPTLTSGFGTSPTLNGGDQTGNVALGTSPSTTLELTFKTAFTNRPTCFIWDETQHAFPSSAPTVNTTSWTATFATTAAADVVSWICSGYQ